MIVKGIMTVKGALKAVEAGADAIIVSNHGGRVLSDTPATAEVLPEIVDAVKGKTKILVDGGVRSGLDVFKALAIGADACLICRPVLIAYYGGRQEGIECYLDKIKAELMDTMYMCGASSISEITRDMIRLPE
jgi:isopentenyl diphosphate isomerase/L-lactate dehydrogenase-like FMN-dependent dehydrogenase